MSTTTTSIVATPHTRVVAVSQPGWLLVMKHLIWKDARLVGSLVAAILAGTVAFNLVVLYSIWSNGTLRNNIDIGVVLWILMPNLMALGAPAMLVGNEEESGTLGWIRALPVSWKSVALSKMIVAFAVVGLAWAFSSLCLGGLVLYWSESLPVFSAESLRLEAIFRSGFFSVQLLLIGLLLAYLFKSPVVSLIVLVPVMVILSIAVNVTGSHDAGASLRRVSAALPYLISVIYLSALGILQFMSAGWRLRRRKPARPLKVLPTTKSQPYASSRAFFLPIKPSIRKALLWQAFRQQAWPLLGLTLIAAVCLMVMWIIRQYAWFTANREAPQGLLWLISTWLGCLCFYGDSLTRRHLFIADRGISANRFWWTRMTFPTSAIAVIFLVAAMIIGFSRTEDVLGLSWLLVAFATGVLVSIWCQRTALMFFVGPVLLLGLFASVVPVLALYKNYYGTFALTTIPLIFATWRVCGRWLHGERGIGFHARIIGYLVLASCLVYTSVLVQRYVMMPTAMPQWRAEMLAKPMPVAFNRIAPRTSAYFWDYWNDWREGLDHETRFKELSIPGMRVQSLDRMHSMELNRLRTLTHQDLAHWRLPDRATESQLRSARWLLQWARSARQAVLTGHIHPTSVLANAEQDELAAVRFLHVLATHPQYISPASRDAVRDVLGELASEELRRDSCQMALVMEWRLYQQQTDPKRAFAGKPVDVAFSAYHLMGLEQLRADRYVDAATKESLKRFSDVDTFSVRREQRLWSATYGSSQWNDALPFNYGTDHFIEQLKGQNEALRSSDSDE